MPKTLIGVLASRDAAKPNNDLIKIFNQLHTTEYLHKIDGFHFIFTGGTYDRFLNHIGNKDIPENELEELDIDAKNWLNNCSTQLPSAQKGGVIILSNLVCQRVCSIVWMLFEPNTIHWQRHIGVRDFLYLTFQ